MTWLTTCESTVGSSITSRASAMKSVTPSAEIWAWKGKTSSRTHDTRRWPFSAFAQSDQRSVSRGTVDAPGWRALRGFRSVQSPANAPAYRFAPGRRAARTRAASAASNM